jgi:probable HAF family extracellular repeat protein
MEDTLMTKHRSVDRTIFLLTLVTLAPTAFAVAPNASQYHVTDLGALNGVHSAGVAINASGQVTGYTTVAESVYQHAFVWTPTTPNGASGAMSDLGTIGGNDSYGSDINASGQVTGFSDGVAFLWSPTTPNGTSGSMIPLGLPDDRFVSGQGINDSGQVAGHAYPPADSSIDAFLWTPTTPNGTSGALHDLGTIGGQYSYSYGINAGGQVVGQSGTSDGLLRGFLWTPITANGASGSMIDLQTLGGMNYSAAWDVNDAGLVVGEANTTADVATHAFLYDGTLHDLGTLGGNSSGAFGINASSQVTGYSETTGNAADHAFLYTSGSGMVDLNSLIDPSLGWQLTIARSINDAGQITGSGRIGGQEHAFLLTPIPEPSFLALLLLGLPLLVRRSSRAFKLTRTYH